MLESQLHLIHGTSENWAWQFVAAIQILRGIASFPLAASPVAARATCRQIQPEANGGSRGFEGLPEVK